MFNYNKNICYKLRRVVNTNTDRYIIAIKHKYVINEEGSYVTNFKCFDFNNNIL